MATTKSTQSNSAAAKAAREPEVPAENPRTARSKERLAEAVELIRAELSSGEWVSSNELHRKLGKEIPEGTFGRAKAALGIVHRRVRGDKGVRYEWRLPTG